MRNDKTWLALPFAAASGRRRPSGSRSNSQEPPAQNNTQAHVPPAQQNGAKPISDGSRKEPAGDNNVGPKSSAKNQQEANGACFASTEEDIVQDSNSPIHVWIITTLFPLMAGTFGPMASMFNICAIVVPWRLVVNPQSTQANGQHIPDPTWLVPINVISLVIALIANLSLLGQMTNRIRFRISAPITICGWYISGMVDIALVSAASQRLPLPDSPWATYSQAFYYAAFSGGIYFILGMLLSVTAYCIFIRQYSEEYRLSLAQRSLMLQTILFLAYILATGGVYSVIEGWSFLDSTYFAVVTLFTIGFGDFSPETHLGRSLFFPFSVGGILFVGVIIANIRSLVLEIGSEKVSTRLVEKARAKAIDRGEPDEGIIKLRGTKRRDTNAPTELGRREKEFNVMREIQQLAALNNRIFSLAFALTAFMILWFIGALVFWKAADSTGGDEWYVKSMGRRALSRDNKAYVLSKTYFESLYFTFVAQLTIGFGDFSPHTNSAKPAFVLWALIALPTLTVLIGSIGDAVSSFVNWYTVWIGNHAQDIWRWVPFLGRKKQAEKQQQKAAREEAEKKEGDEGGFHGIANIHDSRQIPLDLDPTAGILTDAQLSIAEETYKPFIMLRAAQTILGHLDEETPRKYDFKEWAWLLRLLGEDERDEMSHRRVGQPVPDGMEVVTPVVTRPGTSGSQTGWSWLGHESPLMNLREGSEPKWVLKRLMEVLERELRASADRKVERKTGVDMDGDGEIGHINKEKQ